MSVTLIPTNVERPALCRAGVELLIAAGKPIPVSGACMEPVVPRGASVRVEACMLPDLRHGDIILMERNGAFFLHRFLKIVPGGEQPRLLTKGDKARRPDPLWPADGLVGRLVETCFEEQIQPYRPGILEWMRGLTSGLFWLQFLRLKAVWKSIGLRQNC